MGRRNSTIQTKQAARTSRSGTAARTALRTMANAALLAALLPGAVCAEGRFALESGVISRGVEAGSVRVRTPDASDRSVMATQAASPYRLYGEFLGQSDEIFADGFDSNVVYDVAFSANVSVGNATVVLGSVNVPAGSYLAFVRLQAQTGSESNPGNNYRFDCDLSPGFDTGVYRVGEEPSVERYLTYQGAATLASAGTIQFSCRDGNGHIDIALGGKLTVISVGAVN